MMILIDVNVINSEEVVLNQLEQKLGSRGILREAILCLSFHRTKIQSKYLAERPWHVDAYPQTYLNFFWTTFTNATPVENLNNMCIR